MNNYTQFDWASDRLARTNWADEEDRMFRSIDKKLNNRRKSKKRKSNK